MSVSLTFRVFAFWCHISLTNKALSILDTYWLLKKHSWWKYQYLVLKMCRVGHVALCLKKNGHLTMKTEDIFSSESMQKLGQRKHILECIFCFESNIQRCSGMTFWSFKMLSLNLNLSFFLLINNNNNNNKIVIVHEKNKGGQNMPHCCSAAICLH